MEDYLVRRRRKRIAVAGRQAPLSSIISSAVFDVDATIAASYPGSGQSFRNLIASPADGALQSAYNLDVGGTSSAESNDPLFVGSGGLPSDYFSATDALNVQRFDISTDVNTTFLESLHKTTGGTPFWLACCFRPADLTSSRIMLGTHSGSTNHGIRLNLSSGEVPAFIQGDGTLANTRNLGSALTIGTDYCLVLTYDAAGNVRHWRNSPTKTTTTLTYGTTTSAAQIPLSIFRSMDAGSRFYSAAMGNAYIDDAEAAKILNMYRFRHARAYA